MSRILDTGAPATTPHTGAWPVAVVPFSSDYRIKASSDGEVVWTNIKSPLDRPETIRQAYSLVNDVYKGTDIAVGVRAASSKGVSILSQVTETWSVTDSTITDYRVDLPVSAHLVIKVPASGDLASVNILALVQKLVGSLYSETIAMDTAKLDALLRGSLK